jgi:hypothetical protein
MSILLRPATRRSHLKTYDRKPGHPLDFLPSDPYHDKTDVMRQMFYQQPDGYAKRQTPQMKGFVWNNGVHEIMWTYTPRSASRDQRARSGVRSLRRLVLLDT